MPSVVLKLTKAVLQRQMIWGLFSSISAYISSSTDNMTNFILFRCSPQALNLKRGPFQESDMSWGLFFPWVYLEELVWKGEVRGGFELLSPESQDSTVVWSWEGTFEEGNVLPIGEKWYIKDSNFLSEMMWSTRKCTFSKCWNKGIDNLKSCI